jgi:hypothetical protein
LRLLDCKFGMQRKLSHHVSDSGRRERT